MTHALSMAWQQTLQPFCLTLLVNPGVLLQHVSIDMQIFYFQIECALSRPEDDPL